MMEVYGGYGECDRADGFRGRFSFYLFLFQYRSVVETRKEMVSRIVLARLNETNHLDNLQFLEEIKNDEQQVLRFNACLISLIEITYITDSNLTYEDALKRFVGWLPNSVT